MILKNKFIYLVVCFFIYFLSYLLIFIYPIFDGFTDLNILRFTLNISVLHFLKLTINKSVLYENKK